MRRKFSPSVVALESRLPLDGSGEMTSTPALVPPPTPVASLAGNLMNYEDPPAYPDPIDLYLNWPTNR